MKDVGSRDQQEQSDQPALLDVSFPIALLLCTVAAAIYYWRHEICHLTADRHHCLPDPGWGGADTVSACLVGTAVLLIFATWLAALLGDRSAKI